MSRVPVAEAQARLAELIAEAAAGEDVVIESEAHAKSTAEQVDARWNAGPREVAPGR